MTRPMTLWQRNVIGAVVAASAIGVLIAIDIAPGWSTYRHTVAPEHVVPAGESGTADGQVWKVESIRHLNRSPVKFGPPLPTGTVLTVITVERSGQFPEKLCTGVITDGSRRWEGEGVAGFNPPLADGVTNMCSRPGRLQYAFVLPRDVVATAMDVTIAGRIIVRMQL